MIKDIVPQQLNPSGVVAMMGTTERGELLMPTFVNSYAEFSDKFGNSEKYSLTKEAKQAFQNGVFEIIVVPIGGKGSASAGTTLKDRAGKDTVRLTAVASGEEGNKVKANLENIEDTDSYRASISDGSSMEIYDKVVMDESSDQYFVQAVNRRSRLVKAEDLNSPSKFPEANPMPGEYYLAGGKAGTISREDYELALAKLEGEPDVDIVTACGVSDPEIHALIEAHCVKCSMDAKNRIGLGSVEKGESIHKIIDRTSAIASDRFVIVAPYGNLGAVAGLLSRLNYYESPTFKPISGIAKLELKYTPSEQMELLKAGILPLEEQRGRGIIVVKGIATSKEQISVVRVADHAVRGVKNIADLFIGTLNSESGRSALRGRITEFLSQMDSEGSIVPSTDGNEPSFLVDVYSSEADFSQGIVRVNIAVRPVRAMDYIYATIKVEA